MNRVLSAAVAAAFAAAAPAGEAAGTPRAAPERRAFRSASDRVEARIAYIKTALKITDAQNAQFEAFANVLRKHAKDRDSRMEAFRAKYMQGGPGMQRHERPQISAIDRMEFMQKRMQERSARLSEVISAAKPLYATFSPEQKQVADEMLSRQGRGGHHRGHHGPRGMHRG